MWKRRSRNQALNFPNTSTDSLSFYMHIYNIYAPLPCKSVWIFLGKQTEMGFWVQGWSCILVGVAVIFSGGMCLAKGEVGEGEGKCDIYEGSWVVDESYPMYNSTLCPHIRREFDCQKYGRPDKLYLRYKWQPKDCDLPRYNWSFSFSSSLRFFFIFLFFEISHCL